MTPHKSRGCVQNSLANRYRPALVLVIHHVGTRNDSRPDESTTAIVSDAVSDTPSAM
jgi:hypothetical protein